MAKADLHVHTRHSDHPSEWFLQRLGASESYTDPFKLYDTLVNRRGMDFVTVTDHNKIRGSLELKAKYPDRVLTGMEATTYFPEDGCKIHLLVYGLDEAQFREIQRVRENIYDLRDYIRDQDLAHSVAHGTYAVNDRLTIAHLEKLILLFNTFEGINGARNRAANNVWLQSLAHLTPAHIERLQDRYGIEPFGDVPWTKGFTGGSDDHAGLYPGRTFTVAEAATPDEFLQRLKDRESAPGGRHNNSQSLAFAVYKIAYDFSRQKKKVAAPSLLGQLTEIIFEEKDIKLRNRLKIQRLKMSDNRMYNLLYDLVNRVRGRGGMPMEEKIDLVYDNVSDVADEFIAAVFRTLEEDIAHGDLVSIIRNVSSAIPGVFLSLPFFTTMRHMSQNRGLLAELRNRFLDAAGPADRHVLWFTDTISDLNGVSYILRNIGELALRKGMDLNIVTSLAPEEVTDDLPPNLVNLPYIHSFKLPGYEHYDLKVPSLLKGMAAVQSYEPDEIFISTPGPVGLAGLMAARIFNVPCTGVYHTDFTMQSRDIIGDESLSAMVEGYIRWFYANMDTIRVPTDQYISILADRGLPRTRMKIFRRGIDTALFAPQALSRMSLSEKFGVGPGVNLLYAGRVSQDKGLDFLFQVFAKLREDRADVNLLLAGDGPYREELEKRHADAPGVHFLGKVNRNRLPDVYSASDLLVFPSTTDTFGMVVLEGQACGLPAVVSDVGGPQELIIPGRTGEVARAFNLHEWTAKITALVNRIDDDPQRLYDMRRAARRNALDNFNWETVFGQLLGDAGAPEADGHAQPRTEKVG